MRNAPTLTPPVRRAYALVMAHANRRLVALLRETARRLEAGSPYQWGHQGSCNCGHLAQTLTGRSRAEIHRAALEKAGRWGDRAVDHCPSSGYPIDHIIGEMLAAGLSRRDLADLEDLSSKRVLARVPAGRHLERNRRADVVSYLELWAEVLEEDLGRDEAAATEARSRTVRPRTVRARAVEAPTAQAPIIQV